MNTLYYIDIGREKNNLFTIEANGSNCVIKINFDLMFRKEFNKKACFIF